MTVICFIILFLWVAILQDELNKVKRKLQKIINEGYVASLKKDNKDIEQQLEASAAESKPDNTIITPEATIKADDVCVKQESAVQMESTTPAPKPEAAASIPDTKPEKGKNQLENIFLGNIFNKIGALAIIIGVIFFIKVVSQYIVFTPVMKCMISFLAGAGMIGYSLKLHCSNMKNYAEVLMGTGFAVLFITIYCASGLYHILPVAASTAIGIALVLLTYFIAEKLKTFSTFIIGFIGGYLNPFFVNSNITIDFLFGYLIFLNIISIVYVSKNESKKILNTINLILTTFTVSVFAAVKSYDINYLYAIALWALYVVNDIIEIVKNRYNDNYKGNLGFNILNFGILLYFIKCFAFKEFPEAGLFAICAAVLYSIFLYFYKTKTNENIKHFAYGILLSLLISTYFTLSGTARVDVWAIEGLVLAYIAKERKYIANWSIVFFITAFTGIFFVPNSIIYNNLNNYIPVFNFRLLLYGIPALGAFIASIWHKENENISKVLKFLALSFVYLFGVFEINAIYGKYLRTNEESLWSLKILTYSIIGFIYSINTKRLADSLQSALFSTASYTIYSLASISLIFAAAAYTNDNMLPVLNIRLLAFVFAIASSLYYFKKTSMGLFAYLALIFGFLCLHFEIFALTDNNALAISLAWILYAGTSTLIGIFKEKTVLKNFGIGVLVLAILKVMLFDIANIEIHYKFIAFIALGIILMIVSYFYSKIKPKAD